MSDRQPRTDADETRALAALQQAMGTLHNEAVTVIAGLRALGFYIWYDEASRGPDLAGLRKALERFVSLTDGWGPALDPASPWMEAYQQGRAALQAGATEPGPRIDEDAEWLRKVATDRLTLQPGAGTIFLSEHTARLILALLDRAATSDVEPGPTGTWSKDVAWEAPGGNPTPPTSDVEPRADPFTERAEHERQSTAGTHLGDPHCPFCFFDHFDGETRANLYRASDVEPRADTERWIEALHEDANGLIWTTKAELRSVLASDVEPPEVRVAVVRDVPQREPGGLSPRQGAVTALGGPVHYPHCNDRCVHHLDGPLASDVEPSPDLDDALHTETSGEPR